MRTLDIPHTPPAADDLQAVFVYGTLRPRRVPRYREGWAGACEVGEATPGSVPGKIYYGPGFPYARYIPGFDSRVRGDVLLCDLRHPMFHHMHGVELRAGYDAREVTVDLEGGGSVGALMYVPNRSAAMYVHPRREILSGDWHDEDELERIQDLLFR